MECGCDFASLNGIAVNGEPQAEANLSSDTCTLPLNK